MQKIEIGTPPQRLWNIANVMTARYTHWLNPDEMTRDVLRAELNRLDAVITGLVLIKIDDDEMVYEFHTTAQVVRFLRDKSIVSGCPVVARVELCNLAVIALIECNGDDFSILKLIDPESNTEIEPALGDVEEVIMFFYMGAYGLNL